MVVDVDDVQQFHEFVVAGADVEAWQDHVTELSRRFRQGRSHGEV